MWLLAQDPTSITQGLAPVTAGLVSALLIGLGFLWRRNVTVEREKQVMAEQVMGLVREVLPVLTDVTNELRRLMDYRDHR